MKKLLLLIIGFFLISLISFGKAANESALENSNLFNKNTKSITPVFERHRVWLNLTNIDGLFKQILVGYVTGATNGIDAGYDGVSIDANRYLDFYSVNNDENLVIQGRALPFIPTDIVPLGYRTTVEGVFTITIDEADGALTTQDIFIEDKVGNVVHNLKNSPYSFTTIAGTFKDRFVLSYVDNFILAIEPNIEDVVINPILTDAVVIAPIVDTVVSEPNLIVETIVAPPVVAEPITLNPNVLTLTDDIALNESLVIESEITFPIVAEVVVNEPALNAPVVKDIALFEELTAPIVLEKNKNGSVFGSNNFNRKEKSVIVSAADYQIKINSLEENIDSVWVYDLMGKQLYEIAAVNSPEFVIPNLDSRVRYLIIRTQLKSGKGFVNKIGF